MSGQAAIDVIWEESKSKKKKIFCGVCAKELFDWLTLMFYHFNQLLLNT